VKEAEREDQLAMARRTPTNVVVQLPDADPPAYVPAPQALLPANTNAATAAPVQPAVTTTAQATNAPVTTSVVNNGPAQSAQPASLNVAAALTQYLGNSPANTSAGASANLTATLQPVNLSDTPPQPSSTTPASAQPLDTAAGSAQETTTPLPSYARPAVAGKSPTVGQSMNSALGNGQALPASALTSELRLMPAEQQMRVGEKQRVALTLIANAPLNSALVKLHFDPRFIAIRGISQGDLSVGGPVVMQSIDPSGFVTVSVIPPTGTNLKSGASVLVFLDIEAVAAGESTISFEKDNIQLSASGSRVTPQLFESKLVVK
jgi:hypothetical protein